MKKSVMAICLLALFSSAHADDPAGKGTYMKFCSKCHGEDANGRGKDAYKYKPAPTNFTAGLAPREYYVEMTKKGGKAMDRSEDMPDWSSDLSDQQIQQVVDYVMSVRNIK